MSSHRNPAPVRLLIADSDSVFRAGLVAHLKGLTGISVMGEADDGEDVVKQAIALKPDVVLIDLKMPKVDGLEATRRIVRAQPDTRVLILTEFRGRSFVLPALRAGAKGYLFKDTDPDSIVHSILAVTSGQQVLAGPLADRVLRLVDSNRSSKRTDEGLTSRQVEILQLLAAGMSNQDIAKQLGLNYKTVRNQVSRLYRTLGLSDRPSAILYALREGLGEG